MKRSPITILCLLCMILLPGTLFAQQSGQVLLESLIQKEIEGVNEKGEKEIRLVEAANAVPGDELIFTVILTNTGSDPAENVIVVNPIPEQTVYLVGTAGGDDTQITFSVDGGTSYDIPENLMVTDKDGQLRQALPQDYTHVRWIKKGVLGPGASGRVYFRARLR